MKEFLRGAAGASGIVAGFLPIAMSFGAISTQAGLSQVETVGMSLWIFAGASQFAVVEAVRQNLSEISILLTLLILNLRHIPMSLAAQSLYRRFAPAKQWLLYWGLVDETFALEMSEPPHSFSYYVGMHFCCWASWVMGTWLGCWVGFQLPEQWLQFALPGLFLCLLCNGVKRNFSRERGLVVGVGIALVLTTQGLGSTGILIAIMAIAVLASVLPKLNESVGEQP